MAGERTYPILPCADLDEALAFYEALGFVRSYLQRRPNPYAVVALEDIVVHLAGYPEHDPATSVSSVIVTVPDAEARYAAFADRLRQHYGRLPSAGIPRILRPRRKQGTATGFSLVDVGGNWLRFYRTGEREDDDASATSLARAELLVRLGRDEEARQTLATAVDLVATADADALREDLEHARDVVGAAGSGDG